MTKSIKQSYRRGLWSTRIWPIILFLIIGGGFIWATFEGFLTFTITAYATAILIVLLFFWSIVQLGRWKMWMVKNSENPKTTLEKARDGFLSNSFLERVAILNPSKRRSFQEQFDSRMSDIRAAHLNSAAAKYDVTNVISVHPKLGSTVYFILFELLVGATLVFLFIYQEDIIVRIIAGFIMFLVVLGLYSSIKSFWKKNITVLEVSQHGIRIEDVYFGWEQLEMIDIVKGDTLVYKPHHTEQQQRKVDGLSMPADYLDELILFYKTTHDTIHKKDAS